MKVFALVLALSLAVCLSALAANPTAKSSNNSNTSYNVNTTNNTNTTNNNASNNANWSNKSNATNNGDTTTNTNKSNKWNKSNTKNNAKWSNNSNASNQTNGANNSNVAAHELMKVSHEGFDAMRAVRAARVAIFNGEPTAAMKWLDKAQADLQNAAKDAPLFVTTTEVAVGGKVVAGELTVAKPNWIPIDGQVSMSDSFVASPEKAKHIQKANQHFQNGWNKKAIEELRLASIDVSCTRVLMSLTTTTNCVAEAAKLVGQKKYFEANMVLKTAEDALVVDSTNVFATPTVKTNKAKEIN
jgi:hypothetical protein